MSPAAPLSRRSAAVLAGLVFALAACGSGGRAPDSPAASAAAAAAAENIDDLAQAANPLDIEVLDVADGSIASLRTAVDGDRPVLLWFWAPH